MKALFVIDVQEEYMKKHEESLLLSINERIKQAAEHNELIINAKNVTKRLSKTMVSEFASGLNVCSSDIIYKAKASIFSEPKLMEVLRRNHVTEIELIGVDGNYCVACSAKDARKLGYKVTLSCKCIGAQNKKRFEKKKADMEKQGIAVLP